MTVTVDDFLRICNNVIETGICRLYIEYYDEDYDAIFSKPSKLIHNMNEFDAYLDWEVVSFHQEFLYGELNEQLLFIRKN